MILNEYIELKISRKNIDHFKQWYKDIKLKDIIQVEPEKLQKSSNIKLDVSCDICGIQRNIKYQAYNKNINSCKEYPIYTCDKCSHVKIKEYNKKKWGVEYYSQTKEYNDKFRKTMKERWGVEYAQQSDIIREKTKETNLEKFGVENPFMDNEMIRNKFKEKWGVDHPSKVKYINDKIKKTKDINNTSLSSPEIREKIKETNNLRYNGHPMRNIDILNKMKYTNLEKWGVEYILQSEICKEKLKNSNLEKWGVDNPMKSEEVRYAFIISKNKNYVKYLGESYSLFYCEKGHEFSINIDNYHSRIKNNTPICTVCNPIGDSKSIKEKELSKYIKSIYKSEVIESYRDGLEIDIYLPNLKLGFEFNGLYWHSQEWKEKNYHLDKTNYFKEKGIRIIHIWEDDWDNNNDIIKSQIRNWLGSNLDRIFARKCKVKILDKNVCRDFLNKNHIQGNDKSIIKIGLFYGTELVSVMTFDKFEGRKKMKDDEWNLSRFCNKINTNVIGGASKLLNYFINNFDTKRIISYADKDWSVGNLYITLGFNNIIESKPDYKYIINNKRVHKSRYKKSILKTELTESKQMELNGINKIYDCGKIKFEKFIK